MPTKRGTRPRGLRRRGANTSLSLEPLETRSLPAPLLSWPGLANPVAETEPNDTLDQAQPLGDLSLGGRAEIIGKIGNTTSGAADIDWYSFTLSQAARVRVTTLDRHTRTSFVSVLTLYNTDTPSSDLFDRLGHRILAQDDGGPRGGDARLERSLAPGTYYVAVSGSGNRYFHPLIAGSGHPGSTGAYGLLVTATDLRLNPEDGPVVLATDPGANARLDRSPFVLRVDFSTAPDPDTVRLNKNVQLEYHPTGTFGDGRDQTVLLARFKASLPARELEFFPAAPLRPGFYRLTVSSGQQGLTDRNGHPLGKTTSRLFGEDFRTSFQIAGVEGSTTVRGASDGTPAATHLLGDITSAGLVQIAGAIGVDATDPIPFNPSNVDRFRFRISGPGRFAFTAEVFAGRIGSPLESAISLFEINSAANQLHLLASNDGTQNYTPTHDRSSVPLATDSIVFAGLTKGEYIVAVSARGQTSSAIGDYVLNLLATPSNTSPKVVSTGLLSGTASADSSILSGPPTALAIEFDKPVNLPQLVLQAVLETGENKLNAVYILGADGRKYHPRLTDYHDDPTRATFAMREALPNGLCQLHLSGSLGLADPAGNPLSGNDPSGDYVVTFRVNGPPRGTPDNPLLWIEQEPNDDPLHPQVLGTLFPADLEAGVQVLRMPPADRSISDNADFYQVTVLRRTSYTFSLDIRGDVSDLRLSLRDPSGGEVPFEEFLGDNGIAIDANLAPGTYVVGVERWSKDQAPNVSYELTISTFHGEEPPPPLTIGPGPGIRIRHVTQSGVIAPAPPAATVAKAIEIPKVPPAPLPLSFRDSPVVLASASAPDLFPTSTDAGSPNELGRIPSSVFLALGARPALGVSVGIAIEAQRNPDPSDRLVTPPLSLLYPEAIVQVPILLQSQHSGTAQAASERGGIASLLEGLMETVDESKWKQFLDLLHRLGTTPPPDSFAPDRADHSRGNDFDPNESDDLSAVPDSEPTGLQAWTFAGILALAFVDRGRPKRRMSEW